VPAPLSGVVPLVLSSSNPPFICNVVSGEGVPIPTFCAEHNPEKQNNTRVNEILFMTLKFEWMYYSIPDED
jgi:hypothetical protein